MKIPGPNYESSYPWLGVLGKIFKLPKTPGKFGAPDFLSFFLELGIEYGEYGLFRYWAFNPNRVPFARAFVMILDPDLVADVIGPKGYGLFSKGMATRLSEPLVGDSYLALADGPEWKHQRKMSIPAFGQQILERTTELVADLLNKNVFPKLDQSSGFIDIAPWMKRLTFDVLGLVAFSFSFRSTETELGKNDDNDFSSDFRAIQDSILHRSSFQYVKYLPSYINKKSLKAQHRLNKVVDDVVTQRLESEKRHDENSTSIKANKDLLSALMERDENGDQLPRKKLLGNIRMFLFAGHDTTSSVVSFALWNLANHPEVQERLRIEVDSVFASNGGASNGPSYKDIHQLAYLDAVMKESLRLDSGAGLSRECLKDVTIGKGKKKYLLPKGTVIYVYPWLIHRNELHWERPNEFIPQRFLNENNALDETKKLRRPFLPFSVGPRLCVGKHLAVAEFKAIIANIVHRYVLEPCSIQAHPVLKLVIHPHEVNIRLRKRRE